MKLSTFIYTTLLSLTCLTLSAQNLQTGHNSHIQCAHHENFLNSFENNLKLQLIKQLDQAAAEKGMSFCYAPGTSNEEIEALYNRIASRNSGLTTSINRPIITNDRFETGLGRWETTAIDGALTLGECFTLTWSFTPDGTMVDGGFFNDEVVPSNLIAEMDLIYGCTSSADLTQSCWFPIFQEVFDQWSAISGVSYVYEPNDDGAPMNLVDFPFLPDGQVGVRGDVRITGFPQDGDGGVLAFNVIPGPFDLDGDNIADIQGGDMFIDMPDNFYSNQTPANNILNMTQVAMHEHGHGLGLAHSCPVNGGEKLMEPFVSTNNPNPNPKLDDRLGAQSLYGDSFCDVSDAIDKAVVAGDGTPQIFENLSVEPVGGEDVFEFTIELPCQIDLLMDPQIGDAYLAGPQDGSVAGDPANCSAGVLFDPNTQANLDLEIVDASGAVIAISNTNPTGEVESISTMLPVAGTYQIRVVNNGETTVQGYTMTCTLGNCAEPRAVDDIPTMGEWGLMCLAICFLIFGVVVIRQSEYAFEA